MRSLHGHDLSHGAASGRLALEAVERNGLSPSTVTITMDNPSGDSQPHSISTEGPGGVSGSGHVLLPVGAHRAAAMEGTLTVQ